MNDTFLSDNGDVSADINYFIQSPTNVNDSLSEFYTLLIDLNQSIENIQEKVYHRTLSEINSFISNQIFEYKLEFNLSSEILNYYISLFNQFAKEKKIKKAEHFRLKAFNENGILAVTYIKQNNKFIYINFYRVTKQRATNLYSFQATTDLNFNSTHLGRAHRALHWLDILQFKNHLIDKYDFCGWYNGNNDAHLLNINKFKDQFTQNIVKEYSGVIYKNKFLKMLKLLIK